VCGDRGWAALGESDVPLEAALRVPGPLRNRGQTLGQSKVRRSEGGAKGNSFNLPDVIPVPATGAWLEAEGVRVEEHRSRLFFRISRKLLIRQAYSAQYDLIGADVGGGLKSCFAAGRRPVVLVDAVAGDAKASD
jgi:hypothetical protein